jgi:hypothetical protein
MHSSCDELVQCSPQPGGGGWFFRVEQHQWYADAKNLHPRSGEVGQALDIGGRRKAHRKPQGHVTLDRNFGNAKAADFQLARKRGRCRGYEAGV